MSTPTATFVRVGVDRRPDRPQRLGEHDGRAAVQQAEGLGVALDRHRRHDPLGGHLDELDPHLLVEPTVALGHEGDQLLDAQAGQGLGCTHAPIVPRARAVPGGGAVSGGG